MITGKICTKAERRPNDEKRKGKIRSIEKGDGANSRTAAQFIVKAAGYQCIGRY